jgi:hypothetical protein
VAFTLTVSALAAATPHVVQTAGATEAAPATSLAATFAGPTTAGDLLVLSASGNTGASNHITSVTDSAGNSWSRIGAYEVSGHNSDGELWYSANASATTTVTEHTASAAAVAFTVQEFAGVATSAPLVTSIGASSSGATPASGSIATTLANELVVGFVGGHANKQAITVTSPGYATQPQQTTSGSASVLASEVTGYRVVSTPGTASVTGSLGTAVYWAAGVAAFRSAGS